MSRKAAKAGKARKTRNSDKAGKSGVWSIDSKSLFVPAATTFIASFCIMVLELVASRLIARYLGSSLYTWTAVIGIVLAGISLGNFLGGRLADRYQAAKCLGILFILCSVSCLTVIPLNRMVGTMETLELWSIPPRVFVHITAVFLFPSILLGTISPLVAKMALDKGLKPGTTIGAIYAWGAGGSIIGTFVTGYYLVATLGSIAIVLAVALVLFLLGVAYICGRKKLAGQGVESGSVEEVSEEKASARSRAMLGLCLTVFLSSACVMMIEMVASRMAAIQLGTSIYTWTSIIGVVLAGITAGNYVGGRLADRFVARTVAALLLMFASISCLLIIILNDLIGLGQWEAIIYLSWPIRVLLHIAMIFLLPSFLLGAVSPVVAKMALNLGLSTGRTVGNIYAWGTAGSIGGTFLAGYVLIATIGPAAIVWLVTGLLIVMGLCYRPRQRVLQVWLGLFVIALCMGCIPQSLLDKAGAPGKALFKAAVRISLRPEPRPRVLYEDDTPYCHVEVKRVREDPEIIAFYQDKLTHSKMQVGNATKLHYSYEQIHGAITGRYSEGKARLSTLTIGGGGYVFPRYIEALWPGSRVDVAEIDPGVTEAAMAAFGLPRDTKITTYTMDARNYVDGLIRKMERGESVEKYEFIYEDALNDYSVPFQLTTKEFNDKIARVLTDDGIYMIEMIDIYDSGLLLGALMTTLESSFSHVQIIVEFGPDAVRKTFVIVASQYELDLTNLQYEEVASDLKLSVLSDAQMQELRDRTGGVILTDNFAPIDNYLAPVVRRAARDILAIKYNAEGLKLYGQKDLEGSLAKCSKLIALDREIYAVPALEKKAELLAELGRLDEAVTHFYEAIRLNDEVAFKRDVSDAYQGLGIALKRQRKFDEAVTPLKKAANGFMKLIKENPKSVSIWTKLGNTCAALGTVSMEIGAYQDARTTWRNAANAYNTVSLLEPSDGAHHEKVIRALLHAGKPDEALKRLDEAVVVMEKWKQPDRAQALRGFKQTVLQQLRQMQQQRAEISQQPPLAQNSP